MGTNLVDISSHLPPLGGVDAFDMIDIDFSHVNANIHFLLGKIYTNIKLNHLS